YAGIVNQSIKLNKCNSSDTLFHLERITYFNAGVNASGVCSFQIIENLLNSCHLSKCHLLLLLLMLFMVLVLLLIVILLWILLLIMMLMLWHPVKLCCIFTFHMLGIWVIIGFVRRGLRLRHAL